MSKENEHSLYQKAASIWKKAKFPIAFTGAGISVPSGIPDFRSPGGLWSKYDPFVVATAQALDTNPAAVWEFMLDTLDLLEKSNPNPAHYALSELEKNNKLKGIITQNIDNLHQRSGSNQVVEYHGNFQRFYCRKCFCQYNHQGIKIKAQSSIPVICEKCGGIIRPDVVFFGESIPIKAQSLSQDWVQKADLILIAGTSGEVAPANLIPRQIKSQDGKVIEINLGKTLYQEITDVRFDASVEEVLPKLAELIIQENPD